MTTLIGERNYSPFECSDDFRSVTFDLINNFFLTTIEKERSRRRRDNLEKKKLAAIRKHLAEDFAEAILTEFGVVAEVTTDSDEVGLTDITVRPLNYDPESYAYSKKRDIDPSFDPAHSSLIIDYESCFWMSGWLSAYMAHK